MSGYEHDHCAKAEIELQAKADENWKLYQETIFQLNAAKGQRDAALLQISAKDAEIAHLSKEEEIERQGRISTADRLETTLEELDAANRLNGELKAALVAECRGISCGPDCYGGYRQCTGCEARADRALGERVRGYAEKPVDEALLKQAKSALLDTKSPGWDEGAARLLKALDDRKICEHSRSRQVFLDLVPTLNRQCEDCGAIFGEKRKHDGPGWQPPAGGNLSQ